MKKLFFIALLFFTTFGFAKNMNVNYGVSFGVLGEMGLANINLTELGDKYTIDINAKTTGMVKVMSGNRKERHISKGHMEKGKFVSDSYEVFISYKNKEKYKIYKIDHKSKTVTKHIVKKRDGKVVSEVTEKLPFYSSNDLITLYMNLPKLISVNSSNSPKTYKFKAIGAENQNGTVEVIIPSSTQVLKYKEVLGSRGDVYFKAIINQPIFESKRGEIMISMNNNGVSNKAILQDLILFGDLVALKK